MVVDTFTVEIEIGAGPVNIGDTLYQTDIETGTQYEITVTAIKHLSWKDKKELVVIVEGEKKFHKQY
ncbi:hypothetical protein [Bacillus paranthracis]|uniref:hypothetical protein n=1 Tax=Bacillus paranthracis TaxID=2026186 RepID=UPI0021D3B1F5|nr:hypothetical protein [Bacillus paranthracis]MCU5208851.1 hypothetical protein [Bacillus paranthracis]